MAGLVPHAELDGERTLADDFLFADLVRSGRGVVRMNQLQPRVVGVRQLSVRVPQNFFPRGRVINLPVTQLQIEKSEWALVGQRRQRGELEIEFDGAGDGGL